jgi:transposase
MRRAYPTDVSDAEWSILEPLLDRKGSRGPARAVDLREVWNAAMYVLGEGCRWRSLPHDLPPWGTVCRYLHRWRREGLLEAANDALRRRVRKAEGRDEEPSLAILDSQSAKAEKGGTAASTAASSSRAASGSSRSTRSASC